MTADLTPFVARRNALRRKIIGQTLGMLVMAALILVAFGFTPAGFLVMFMLFTGFGKGMHSSWRHLYQAAQEELSDATVTLETQRALLRRSGKRRDADAGLSLSDEATGGELAVGQDGEIGEEQ